MTERDPLSDSLAGVCVHGRDFHALELLGRKQGCQFVNK
jgi:hypothetical protein